MKKSYIILFIIFIILLTGCTTNTSQKTKQSNVIYTSVYPIEFVTKEIAGDTVDVKSIYPPGVDVHSYEPTSKEIANIAKSDGLFYIGSGLESFTDTLVNTLEQQDLNFLEIGKNKELFLKNTDNTHEAEHDHGDYDPHVWLDPDRMTTIADMVYEQLVELYPDHESLYKKNLNNLTKKFTSLDKQFSETLQPKKDKHILVAHAAYGYWENRYGIKQIAVNGMFEKEPSQKELSEITKTAKKHQIQYVLFEQNGKDRVTKIIQEHIGAKPLKLHNLEVLTDNDIEKKQDYITLMKHNLSVLDKATK